MVDGTPMDRRARIDEDGIAELVLAFYARVRRDPLLGPVFHAAVGTTDAEWIAHLDRIAAFWSSVLLGTGRYQGRPMVAHAALPGIGAAHFERWLSLFGETAAALFEPEPAGRLADTAARIGRSLQHGLALHAASRG